MRLKTKIRVGKIRPNHNITGSSNSSLGLRHARSATRFWSEIIATPAG
jgi:hypothetical protein